MYWLALCGENDVWVGPALDTLKRSVLTAVAGTCRRQARSAHAPGGWMDWMEPSIALVSPQYKTLFALKALRRPRRHPGATERMCT